MEEVKKHRVPVIITKKGRVVAKLVPLAAGCLSRPGEDDGERRRGIDRCAW
jgi:antitoxin (DNA-binding transcriptional repressor) of toxin-antitoxin stability system